MGKKFSILRSLCKVFSTPGYGVAPGGYHLVSANDPLPPAVLDTICSVHRTKGWQWKGEYCKLAGEDGGIDEVLMYTPHGGQHVVRIRESGELVFTSPREEPFFLYQALYLPEYMHL